ncbi:MAG: esterase/lipase family protein [Planctomycetota bacterium]|jgi:pimeloyl-ACP methyl ester carboxylesterase
MMLRVLSVVALAVLLGHAAPAAPPPAAGENGEVVEIRIPLDEGQVRVRDLLETICREAGVDPGANFAAVDWTIDVGSTAGRLQLRVFERLAPGAITTDVQAGALVIGVDRKALAARSDKVLAAAERWVLDAAGWGPTERRFGISVVTRAEPRGPMTELPQGTTRAVVLVHGLDDPGWMWRDLKPHLLEAGHVVLRFEYPNDQPIADSADYLAMHLQSLRMIGIVEVDIVAHSMGGLISRDVLTRRAYYNSDGSGGQRFPAVKRLIMLGTPNHGSAMVRLRGVSELREQVYRWFAGEWSWRDSLADGAGEAAQDLLPGSDFLRRLNDRPHPAPTRYTIVAGQLSPVSEEDLATLAQRVEALARSMGMEETAGSRLATSMFQEAVRGIGDGVVSIESARLPGVDDTVVVEANHLSMIVNLFRSDSTPPAIPIVLERLARQEETGTGGRRD